MESEEPLPKSMNPGCSNNSDSAGPLSAIHPGSHRPWKEDYLQFMGLATMLPASLSLHTFIRTHQGHGNPALT